MMGAKDAGFTRRAEDYEAYCWSPLLEINNAVELEELWARADVKPRPCLTALHSSIPRDRFRHRPSAAVA